MNRSVIAILIVAAFPSTAQAQELTVYSSLPLSGASRVSTEAVNDGARQALSEAGGQAAGRPVRLATLNSATKKTGSWTPERTANNGIRAAKDASTIGYIGEFNSGATKVSLPILNEAGIPMISPANTYNGLTTSGPGTTSREPAKFYPNGLRNYFRLQPNDHVQAAALTTAMRDRGCKRLGLIHDGEIYGRGMNTDMKATAARLGLPVVASRKVTRGAPKALRRAKADCVAFTGITANGAVRLFRDAGKALPKAQFFGSDGIAESGFTSRIPRSVGRRTIVSVATLYSTVYGLSDSTDPYFAFGKEAMKLILDGINAVGPDRAALIGWLHGVQNRPSPIGTYGFDANGDTTLRAYGLYGVRTKELYWVGPVTAA